MSICNHCGKEFTPVNRTWVTRKKGKQKYCSRNCRIATYIKASWPNLKKKIDSDPIYRERYLNYFRVYKSENLAVRQVCSARSWLRRKYGITLEEYQRISDSQGGVCAICRKPEADNRRRLLSVDHDHKTHEIRGLLCMRCNFALGYLRDEPELALKAYQYLKEAVSERVHVA